VDADELPPFDENAKCPKCRSPRVISVVFHRCFKRGFPCYEDDLALGEHLCRVCGRCGYGWCEATAEAGATRRAGLRPVDP